MNSGQLPLSAPKVYFVVVVVVMIQIAI
jgi:hypothetical protein